jgi:hypothetical protein
LQATVFSHWEEEGDDGRVGVAAGDGIVGDGGTVARKEMVVVRLLLLLSLILR